MHNQAHLEAVWDVADQLAGPEFPMTPLETFVFGGAVLLHDLAHSVTAYRGGIDAVRKTPEWRQAVLWRLDLADDAPDPSDQEIEHPGDEIAREALFDTLRTLHAEQAEKLHDIPYALPDGEIYLIDDIVLRRHFGLTIGKIAASHHWDREKLRPRLRKQIGPLGWAPKLGSIQPVRLACLLRCADACQIDQRRAPDFDLALQAPIGMSKKHWQAQNRLTPPTIDDDSPAFTSTQAFDQEDADVWWIAHDLIQIAHRELQECAALMRDQDLPPLRVTGVAGASDPAKLATDYVETEGWVPVDASYSDDLPEGILHKAARFLTPMKDQHGTLIGWATLSFEQTYRGKGSLRISKAQGLRIDRGLSAQKEGGTSGLASFGAVGALPCLIPTRLVNDSFVNSRFW